MICPPCRRAGILNADANRVYDPDSAKSLRLKAEESHSWCTGCDCAHRVGDWTNRRKDG